ncbi:putative chiasma assembly protein [Lyophyllum shimeji]|uniref:Chiasma assembly protein n=1 Tax=Lyophyllum shimeji TaxID=47721 RepID=A0A9P3PCZ6_LYOSH|nr:putative chiasma assembly protein [Lyophyllum shimeji]
MDTDLKCNRLTCRQSLTDKAVVTTCSHIFCVECANELFSAARLCPACDTTLGEADDVVVSSLHPSNDYKTSVLSGLTPSTILEICSRAISFWQYQIFQENAFQQAVMRSLNDKNAQLQKQLENVVREANGEISLLNNKIAELERDLELERRKVRELQDSSRDREKEYQKLKLLHDKLKRKALLAPHPSGHDGHPSLGLNEEQHLKQRAFGTNLGNAVNLGAVVGGMEATGVQRTPIVNRTMAFIPPGQIQPQHNVGTWAQQQRPQQAHARKKSHRQPFAAPADRSYRSTTDHSDSANEVENMLVNDHGGGRSHPTHTGWTTTPHQPIRTNPTPQGIQGFAGNTGTSRRTGSKFRPAGGMSRP